MNIVKHITELAAGSLKDHIIMHSSVSSDGQCAATWTVGRPDGGSAYRFMVMTVPRQSLLIITGDLGCCVWQRDTDMVRWARGAVKDIRYFAEKVAASGKPTREFSLDKCKSMLQAAEEDGSSVLNDVLNHEFVVQYGLDGCEPGLLKQIIHDNGHWDGEDFPDFNDWNSQFLWQWRAIVKWLELIGDKA